MNFIHYGTVTQIRATTETVHPSLRDPQRIPPYPGRPQDPEDSTMPEADYQSFTGL